MTVDAVMSMLYLHLKSFRYIKLHLRFHNLLNHDDYEILNVYPFTIRRKRDHYEVTESVHKSTGYYRVTLNRIKYLKHRLIAEQFIQFTKC